MILTYRLSQDPQELSVEVAVYQDFETWLWGLGGGAEKVSADNRAWWADAWRKLCKESIEGGMCLALPRRLPPGVVTIIRKDAPPRA